MADSATYSVALVTLQASPSEVAYITNAGYPITYEGHEFVNAESLEIDIPAITGMMEGTDCNIKKIPISGLFMTELSNNKPFSKIAVDIKQLELNVDTDAVVSTHFLFNGLVYQVLPMPSTGYMDIVAKDWKYYTEITAGMPCTEQCAWSVFGGRGCEKSVTEEDHIVASVSGLNLTLIDDLTDTTPLLFNKGYIELEGVRLKIKYHSSGRVFSLAKAPPSSWVGELVTIYAGCDRQIKTCRAIHNNETRFLGLGYSMIDYNSLYEQP